MKLSVQLQRIILTLFFLVVTSSEIFSAVIPESQARSVAGDFVFWNGGSRAGSPSLELAHVVKSDGADRMYIYNVSGGGWVMVSANDNTRREVLGYSPTGTFDYAALPENAKSWIDNYGEVISQLDSHPEYIRKDSVMNSRASGAVAPLLGEIAWGQGDPYNFLCPVLDDGTRAVTGCVATAMAQIMMYHRYPEFGQGEVSYLWNDKTLSTILGKYDWNLMRPTYVGNEDDASKQAVATLMRDCGYAAKTDYDSGGSGASDMVAFNALVENFTYDKNLIWLMRPNFDTESWENILRDELDAARPVLYAGEDGYGHEFVCDGYDDKGYFHFNWGWNGSSNGYFISGENFSNFQTIICGIQPDCGGKGRADMTVHTFYNSGNNNIVIVYEVVALNNVVAEVGFELENKVTGNKTAFLEDKIKLDGDNSYYKWSGNFHPDWKGVDDGEYIMYPVVRLEGEDNWHKSSFRASNFPEGTDRFIKMSVRNGKYIIPEDTCSIDGINYIKRFAYAGNEGPIFEMEAIGGNIGNEENLTVPEVVTVEGKAYSVSKVDIKDAPGLKSLTTAIPLVNVSGCINFQELNFKGSTLRGSCDSPSLEFITMTKDMAYYSFSTINSKIKKIEFPIEKKGLVLDGISTFPDSCHIYFYTETPPTIKNKEYNKNRGITFHVPYGAKDIYIQAGFDKIGLIVEENDLIVRNPVEWGLDGGFYDEPGYLSMRYGENDLELAVKFNKNAAEKYKGKKITAINYYLPDCRFNWQVQK